MITITNNKKLYPGCIVKVIEAEYGALGAGEKIGTYVGLNGNVSIPLSAEIHGLTSYDRNNAVVKTAHDVYWIIGKNVELEIIDSDKKWRKSKEIIMEVRRKKLIIEDFEISRSGKGIKVNFTDGTYKKAYASEPDEFDFKTALYICLAKKLQNEYKCKDIEELARILSMTKKYIKEVEEVYSEYKKEEESKRIIANRRAKKIRYKANKKAREREEMIEIQKEAYLRAMREANK